MIDKRLLLCGKLAINTRVTFQIRWWYKLCCAIFLFFSISRFFNHRESYRIKSFARETIYYDLFIFHSFNSRKLLEKIFHFFFLSFFFPPRFLSMLSPRPNEVYCKLKTVKTMGGNREKLVVTVDEILFSTTLNCWKPGQSLIASSSHIPEAFKANKARQKVLFVFQWSTTLEVWSRGLLHGSLFCVKQYPKKQIQNETSEFLSLFFLVYLHRYVLPCYTFASV